MIYKKDSKKNSKLPLEIDLRSMKDKFLFIPIGGCDSIGSNFYLYHYKNHWIGVDYGMSHSKILGIDRYLPSLDFLEVNKIKLDGLIITHIHEDHVGGVLDVYKKLNCKIYCTTFVKNFLKKKSEKETQKLKLDINEIKSNKKRFKIGVFSIELIGLTHSTVEAQGVYIKTNKGSVFHTGDWKFDKNPVLGKKSDKKRLSEIVSKEPLSVLICDSTNCTSDRESQSESLLLDSLTKIVKSKKNAVVITAFSSNIQRLHTICKVAKLTKRYLILLGQSMVDMIQVAQKSGYLKDVKWFYESGAKRFSRNKLLILATGSQGQSTAGMNRLANDNSSIKLQKEDCVIFSSRVIPGNEVEVSKIIDKFIAKGVEVITNNEEHLTHVSGHAYKPDLKEMYNITKPKCFIPMHGNWSMLYKHERFAKKCGIKSVVTPENGYIIEINGNTIKKIGNFECPLKYLDGNRLLDENNDIFKDRKKIYSSGFVYCFVVIDEKCKLLTDPEIKTIGIFDEKNKEHAEQVQWIIKRSISSIKPSLLKKKIKKKVDIERILKNSLKQLIKKKTLKDPEIDVVVIVI